MTGSAPRRVAMIGAGQLARMTLQAAVDLDVELVVLAGSGDDPAVTAGARHVLGTPQRLEDLQAVAARADVVTFDHELVPEAHLYELERRGVPLRPSRAALAVAQDKLHARRLLAAAGYPLPIFAEVRTRDEVLEFASEQGWPIVLKSPRGGYDGRGVTVVAAPAELDAVLESPATAGPPREPSWLVERRLELEAELAVLVARREDGESRAFPVVETRQRDGICVELAMPAPVPEALAREATELAISIAAQIGATGICAVELFVEAGGRLSVNECALRPHNSGHATIEACLTSQFHQHLRAVLGWPLGDPALVVPAAATVNLIGGVEPNDPGARLAGLQLDGVAVHLYAKAWRPGRKLGHVTAVGPTTADALERARAAAARLLA